MELKRTASCEGQGVHGKRRMIDRFNDLPDQVAHHILSFLTITHLARFGCVSRRCRELYLSAPSLDIDEFAHVDDSKCSKLQRWLNCMDRFFFRRGNNKIQCLRVRWISHFVDDSDVDDDDDDDENGDGRLCSCNEYFRIMSWIHNAVRCNVEELDLDIGPGDAIAPVFPSSVFLCGSLTSLSVDLGSTALHMPSFAFSSKLKYLKLKSGKVEEGFSNWISCWCKCIEELILDGVSMQDTTIESSSLKKFSFVGDDSTCLLDIRGVKLEEIVIDWLILSPSEASLNIFAPSLKYLSWKGNLMESRNIGKLEFLEEAAILLKPEVNGSGNVFEVLSSLCRTKALSINEATIKASYREKSIPASFDDVSSLHIHIKSFVDELVPAVVSLFKGMPNLCTLYINSKRSLYGSESDASGFNMGYWKMQNFAFIHQLKKVSVELSHGTNGVELIRFILECAQNLETMHIIHLPQNLDDLMMKLCESLKIKLSNATVLFKESEKWG